MDTLDRLLNPEDSLAPYSCELSKSLLDLLVTMVQEERTFNSQRNGYFKTHLVASVLERAGKYSKSIAKKSRNPLIIAKSG